MVLRVLEQGWSVTEAAAAAGASDRTCRKWRDRYLAEGRAGLLDRSLAPRSIPHRTAGELVEVIVLLRKLRMTGAEIAFCLTMALPTVSAVLLRVGLGKLSRLEPPEPPNRYERRHTGELLHVDVKKLGVITGSATASAASANPRTPIVGPAGRGAPKGWEFVHVCVDDATRLAYVEVLTDEKAVAFYASHDITVQAVMPQRGLPSLHDSRLRLRRAGDPSPADAPYRPRHKPPIARLTELNNQPGSYI